MLVVDLAAEAEREAHEAFCGYQERDPGTGDRFEEAFVRAILEIAEASSQRPEIETGIRCRLLSPFPYAILSQIEATSVLVLTVMHTRRRPGY